MLKNEKGISLITTVMTVIIMIIILATLTYTAYTNVRIRNLNKLYNDIRTLNDEVAVYYLKNGTLPVDYDTAYTIAIGSTTDSSSGKDLSFVTNDGEFTSQDDLVNPNDYDNGQAVYYKLDLDLFDNITLSYDDDYIINEKSHTIYYINGVKGGSDKYYCIPLNYENVNYNTKTPVKSIVTTALYLPMGGNSINLKDAITFYAEDGTATGVPKTITYTFSECTSDDLYEIDESSGILTSTDESISAYSAPYVSFNVSLTNYDGTELENAGVVKVYFTDLIIGESNSSTTSKTEQVLTVSDDEVQIGYIYAYGSVGDITTTVATSGTGSITAEIDDDGYLVITPTTAGKYVVTITESNGKASKDIIVYVLDSSVDLTSLTMIPGSTEDVNLTIDGLDECGLTATVEWTTNNNTVASVLASSDGLIVTVTPGSYGSTTIYCTITLSGDDLEENYTLDTISISVTVTGISLTNCSLYECDESGTTSGDALAALTEGQTGILIGYEVDSSLGTKDSDYTITWSSSDKDVATISSSSGVITAISAGTTTITATVTVDETTTYSDTYILIVN